MTIVISYNVDMNTPIVLSFTKQRASILKKQKGAKMAYVIDQDKCIQCGACEAECPEGAISEVDGIYTIDAARCSECGSCADVCPSEAPQKA